MIFFTAQPETTLDFQRLNQLLKQLVTHQTQLRNRWRDSYTQIKNQETETSVDAKALEKLAKLQIILCANRNVISTINQLCSRYKKLSPEEPYGIKNYDERGIHDWVLSITGNDIKNQKTIIEILNNAPTNLDAQDNMYPIQEYIDKMRNNLVNTKLLSLNQLTQHNINWLRASGTVAFLSFCSLPLFLMLSHAPVIIFVIIGVTLPLICAASGITFIEYLQEKQRLDLSLNPAPAGILDDADMKDQKISDVTKSNLHATINAILANKNPLSAVKLLEEVLSSENTDSNAQDNAGKRLYSTTIY
ncbi:MAG: hypothetical protein Q8R83_06970 [Legionellaceae bacterium]|nr:hypothetical protein [Legionellaceae bacterium]